MALCLEAALETENLKSESSSVFYVFGVDLDHCGFKSLMMSNFFYLIPFAIVTCKMHAYTISIVDKDGQYKYF